MIFKWLRLRRSAAVPSLGSDSSTGDGNFLAKPEAICPQEHQPLPKDGPRCSQLSLRQGTSFFPQRRIRHGFFQGEAPGPGTSGGCPSIPAAGTLLRRPGARRGHPAGRPGLPPLLRPGLPGAARAWAREAPRPRRGEAVPPYLRLCGSG